MTCSTSTWPSSRAAIAALILVAAAACGAAQAGDGGGAGQASDFMLRDIEGRSVRLSDHRGKVVLINFWATWCVPCAAELPHLQRLYTEYADDGFVVLAISMDSPDSAAGVAPQARRYGLTFPVMIDEETRVVGVYNPKRNAPYTVMINRAGQVAKTREGYHTGDEVAIENDIKAMVAGP